MDGVAEFFNLLKQYWYKKTALFLILIIPFILILTFCQFKFNELKLSQIIVITTSTVLLFLYWVFTNKETKFKKNVIGILFIIRTENEEQYNTIKSRLVEEIEEKLNSNFQVIFLKRSRANSKKICTETINQIFTKTNAKLILFGKSYCGNINNTENIVIELGGAVSHSPIPEEIKKDLSGEMQQLIKKEIFIPKNNDIVNFKIYSEWFELVTKYIVGLSFYLSANFDLAKDIYEDLNNEVSIIRLNIPIISQIKSKIPQRLYETYNVLSKITYFRYRNSKDKSFLQDMKCYLDKMNKLIPETYEYLLRSSIYYFLYERNLYKSKDEIRKCKNIRDVSWIYSDAFLDTYKGKLRDAYKKYMIAFKRNFDHILLFDIEDFITDVLEEEPDKYQLYFALGLINFHYKGDNIFAYQHFDTFIKNINPRYVNEIKIASEYMQQIIEKNLAESGISQAAAISLK